MHIVLSETTPSNNFQKQTEEVKLKAATVILQALNNVWRCTKPEADVVNEITKGNPVLQILANIFVETLGPQAAECAVLLEDLLLHKLDLLTHCTNWIWSVLPRQVRQNVFFSLISNPDHYTRCHAIHLNSHAFLFDAFEDEAIMKIL